MKWRRVNPNPPPCALFRSTTVFGPPQGKAPSRGALSFGDAPSLRPGVGYGDNGEMSHRALCLGGRGGGGVICPQETPPDFQSHCMNGSTHSPPPTHIHTPQSDVLGEGKINSGGCNELCLGYGWDLEGDRGGV